MYFVTRGRKSNMVLVLQVVSSHLLGVAGIESALCAQACLANRLLPHAANEAEALNRVNFPRLFLLDGCSITFPLGPLSSRLRANSPGSRFLALLAPDRSGEAEMLQLFHWALTACWSWTRTGKWSFLGGPRSPEVRVGVS